MTAGRPRKYQSVEEMVNKIELYFQDEDEKPFTVTGLALYLDLTKEGFREYSHREEFSVPIKKAKAKIEDHINKMMLKNECNPVGAIFNLKNNFGYCDKGKDQREFENKLALEKLELEKRKVKLLENQAMGSDDDFEYVFEDEENEKNN